MTKEQEKALEIVSKMVMDIRNDMNVDVDTRRSIYADWDSVKTEFEIQDMIKRRKNER